MSEIKANILLVEDDQNLGFVVQDALKRKGYSVHLCRDGKEGLKYFNEHAYDICILDVMLPQKDGFSLAEDIRRSDEKVPIVFLTAKSQTDDRIAGFKAGGDDYLTKPFSHEVLPRELVLNMVWGDDTYFLGRSLDVFISRLRKYLRLDPRIHINNVHGVGFRFQVD